MKTTIRENPFKPLLVWVYPAALAFAVASYVSLPLVHKNYSSARRYANPTTIPATQPDSSVRKIDSGRLEESL